MSLRTGWGAFPSLGLVCNCFRVPNHREGRGREIRTSLSPRERVRVRASTSQPKPLYERREMLRSIPWIPLENAIQWPWMGQETMFQALPRHSRHKPSGPVRGHDKWGGFWRFRTGLSGPPVTIHPVLLREYENLGYPYGYHRKLSGPPVHFKWGALGSDPGALWQPPVNLLFSASDEPLG